MVEERTGVFLTGATGFLGTFIVRELLGATDAPIYALVRARDEREAGIRLRNLWWEQPELRDAVGHRVFPVVGNLTEPGMALSADDRARIIAACGFVVHAAAQVEIMKSRAEMQRVNVGGTREALELAWDMQTSGNMGRFAFVSTAYVAGALDGHIPADELPEHAFNSAYEESKWQAECLVRQSGLPFTVFRPGMIVGDSETGRIATFNTVYYVLKLLLTQGIRFLPVSRRQRVNIVPVDYVARILVGLLFDGDAQGKTFHLVTPKGKQPQIGELVDYVRAWAKRELGVSVPRMLCVPIPGLANRGATRNMQGEERAHGRAANLMALTPYFYDRRDFDMENLGPRGHELPLWRDYIDSMLAYACRKNFLHHSSRTVFEQAAFRRKSASAPVVYHDVSAQGISNMPSKEMDDLIARIHAALDAWGVTPGDRIAVAGANSTTYFALDMALGLAGAVSVPVYYTTPPKEIDALLRVRRASMLFVGDARIMSRVDQVEADVPIVAFGGVDVPASADDVVRWNAFLERGVGRTPSPALVDYGELATIRSTSGTTGLPKGVLFNHYQLRWMGEVLAALLGWRGRTTEMRYLSFLPMSHVVEGILATYAPYYMRAKTDLYYLNDFAALAESLPKIRPTVFFSVPRFYEKVWDQFAANPAGQRYLAMKDGPVKRAFARVARRKLLKLAGLDACDQLLVGSAPVSRKLLESYRELGIEIHNAYGQTEAPLITLSRLGDNQLGSVGAALPDTQIRIAEDGEIVVRGPQVALGYDGLQSQSVGGGVLRTGDIGTLDAEGHLSLVGRQKEMLVTSYGKNVNMQKVETALKGIPGVDEAVVVGEGRPFCSALLWLGQDCSEEGLEGEITRVNAGLSHPEQVKRWVVEREPLSIAKGELTPNLKVRHAVVEEHYRADIEALYEGHGGVASRGSAKGA